MPTCWASSLGNCSPKQSREHTVSKNLLTGGEITVAGYPWCEGKEVTLPPEALAQNILCTNHNSALSDTDTAGGQLFKTIHAFKSVARARLYDGKKPKHINVYHLAGDLVERWMLKTVINSGIARTRSTWWPPERWVRMAFGEEPFHKPMGFYFTASDFRSIAPGTYEIVVTLLNDNGRPVGGLVTLDELTFAICAEPYDRRPGWQYRPKAIADQDGLDRWQKIIFAWRG